MEQKYNGFKDPARSGPRGRSYKDHVEYTQRLKDSTNPTGPACTQFEARQIVDREIRNEAKSKEIKSLFICGCCGVDTRKIDSKIEKVAFSGYANMLCSSCVNKFNAALACVAERFLSED